MVVDYLPDQGDSLGHADIRQAYQTTMGNPVQVDEFSEILVYRDQYSIFRFGSFQQGPVSWIWPQGPDVYNVVPVVAKPLRQPAPCAPVYDESQGPKTETGANVSPDMTMWA